MRVSRFACIEHAFANRLPRSWVVVPLATTRIRLRNTTNYAVSAGRPRRRNARRSECWSCRPRAVSESCPAGPRPRVGSWPYRAARCGRRSGPHPHRARPALEAPAPVPCCSPPLLPCREAARAADTPSTSSPNPALAAALQGPRAAAPPCPPCASPQPRSWFGVIS
jgi:hypothetical protein